MEREVRAVEQRGGGVGCKNKSSALLRGLFCLLLPFCFCSSLAGQVSSIIENVTARVSGREYKNVPAKFCGGKDRNVEIYFGYLLPTGFTIPTVTWTVVGGDPVPSSKWDSDSRRLTVEPEKTTTYEATLSYTVFGEPRTEKKQVEVLFYKQPVIELSDQRFESGKPPVPLCGGVGDFTLKGYDKDNWNVVNDPQSVFSFNDGKFVYKGSGGTDNGEEYAFRFTVSQKDLEQCSSDFEQGVKVYKPKEIQVDLEGTFCAGAAPMAESFTKVPADGTCDVALYKKNETTAEWTKSAGDAKGVQIAESGEYKVKTNYSFMLPGIAEQCRSKEVENEFSVVAVPTAPRWNRPSPLSICGSTEVRVSEAVPSVGGIKYEYSLLPSAGGVKVWEAGDDAVSFSLGEAGQYRVNLALRGVKGCPSLQSDVLEVKMQETLRGTRKDEQPLLCEAQDQSILGQAEEKKIGYTDIAPQSADTYSYRWVREAPRAEGASAPMSFSEVSLTFRGDGSGTGQTGNIKPAAGSNSYVLQYKLDGADKECWRTMGEAFTVTLTPKIINKIVATGAGVCTGVEPEINSAELGGGGDDARTVVWIQNGDETSCRGVDWCEAVTAGRYQRRVTSGGCKSESNAVEISQLADPEIEVVKTLLPRCKAVKDGEIIVSAKKPVGGQVAFSFQGGSEQGNFEAFSLVGSPINKAGLEAGVYRVKAKTKDGCMSNTLEENLEVNDEFKIKEIGGTTSTCWGTPVEVSIQWEGGNFRNGDGYFFSLQREGTVAPAHENLGATTSVRKTLKEGKYTAEVRFSGRDGGCIAEREFEVKEPGKLVLKPYDVLCPGGDDGMVRATVDGAEGAVYMLEKKSAGEWVLDAVNTDGIFLGLEKGEYGVRVSLTSTCKSGRETVAVGGEDPIKIEFSPKDAKVRCPGGVIDRLRATVPSVGAFTNYIWSRVDTTKSNAATYITTSKPELLDALVGKYSLAAVRSDGCVVNSDTLRVKGPAPFAWSQLPTVTAAECDGYKGSEVSKGSVILYGVQGGDAPQAWWELTPNPEDEGQPVKYNTTYYLRSGVWRVRVEDANGCKGELPLEIGFVPRNSVKFALRHEKEGESFCFGEKVRGVRVEEDPTSHSHIDNTVPPVLMLEREAGGKLLVEPLVKEADGTYTTPRGLEPQSRLRAIVQSEAGCRSELVTPVSVFPQIQVQYDPLLSDVDVFFHQQVVDEKRSWHDANGQIVYRVTKDSIVAGVLADVPRKVGVGVNYLSTLMPRLEYTTEPAGVLTPSPDNKNQYEIMLSSDAMERYRAEGRVVAGQFGRRPIDMLRTTIRVTDPKTMCSESFDLYVRLIRELSIPNVFTPNGDGINDRWLCNSDPTYQTIFSKLTTLLPNIEVEVFNRAGARVWHAKAEKVAEGWDGTSGGIYGEAELPVGTYYYVIRFNVEGANSWKPIAGSVTIVR